MLRQLSIGQNFRLSRDNFQNRDLKYRFLVPSACVEKVRVPSVIFSTAIAWDPTDVFLLSYSIREFENFNSYKTLRYFRKFDS